MALGRLSARKLRELLISPLANYSRDCGSCNCNTDTVYRSDTDVARSSRQSPKFFIAVLHNEDGEYLHKLYIPEN